jgi:hypothetical protein
MSSSLFPNRCGPPHAMHELTFQRLVWRYGHARAINIVDGMDESTNADLAAWRALGNKGGTSVRGMVRR